MTQQENATQNFFIDEESLEKQRQSALDDFEDAIKNRDKATIQPLLDDFAGKAMQAICVNAGRNGFKFSSVEVIAAKAYDIATAMVQERERRMKG